jgi:hypothetical protein
MLRRTVVGTDIVHDRSSSTTVEKRTGSSSFDEQYCHAMTVLKLRSTADPSHTLNARLVGGLVHG